MSTPTRNDPAAPEAGLALHPVTPHLVCAGAAEALDFYARAFGAEETARLPGPDGRLVHACARVNGSTVMLMDEFPEMGAVGPAASGGSPVTIHLQVDDADAFAARAEAAGAVVVMPVADQFWGDRYGVVRDPFGHRWSIGQTVREVPLEAMERAMAAMTDAPAEPAAPPWARVATCLWFDGAAEEAAAFYASLLPGSRVVDVHRPEPAGPALTVSFTLAGTPYLALNGGAGHPHTEAASIAVATRDQAETDRLWEALTAGGGRAIACGWLADRFGVRWQVIPEALPRLLASPDRAAAGRVMTAMMGMVKIDVAAIEAAHAGAAVDEEAPA